MQVWVRLGTVVSLTLAAATLPVSARSPSAAVPPTSPDTDQPAPADRQSPVSPAVPSDGGNAGESSPAQLPAEQQARHSVLILQITPNPEVWEAGGARTLDSGTGPALIAALLGGDTGVPFAAAAPDRRPAAPDAASCHARRTWLVCRYPHAPPVGC